MKRLALILAGGKGTRLWPLSRENYPKQFAEFFVELKNSLSLFQRTVLRLLSIYKPQDIFLVSQKNYQFNIINQLEQLKEVSGGVKDTLKKNLILEPVGKNTLPAILLAMRYIEDRKGIGEKDTIAIYPSDHFIEPLGLFKSSVSKAQRMANSDKIVVFGLKPTHPKEGYGYIEVEKRPYKEAFLVRRFVEKPDKHKAQKLIKEGAFWNSGMFFFNKETFLNEIASFKPQLYRLYKKGYSALRKSFKDIIADSIDYGIMQKSRKAALVEFHPQWIDLGNWDSYIDFHYKKKENFHMGKAEFLESKNCFTYSKERLICMVGLRDVAAIDSPDALLLVKKGESDKVKNLIQRINQKRHPHSKESSTVHRPWGYYTILHEDAGYKVKEIGIYAKKSLSLQSHEFRSEHWNVVKGKVGVVVNGKRRVARENQSIYVPRNKKHRIYNPTDSIAKIIEVQIGPRISEGDIVRYTQY